MPRLLAVAAVVLLTVLPACGGGGTSSTDTTGTTSGTTATTGAGSTGTATTNGTETPSGTTSTGQATAGAEGDEGFEYVPWGPDDPPIPGHYAALAASDAKAPQCDTLAEQKPDAAFWTTAVQVCRAIAEGGAWPSSTSVPSPPPPENDYIACVDAELVAMLERALRWHAENPGRQPRVEFPEAAVRSPCQARIYAIRVLDSDDLVDGESAPDGVGLAITGASMGSVADVTVDGSPAEFTSDFDVPDPGGGLTTVVVLAALPSSARTVDVSVRTDRDVLAGRVELPGDPDDGTATSTEGATSTDTATATSSGAATSTDGSSGSATGVSTP